MKQYYSYENFRDDTKSLIQEVSSFEPQAIVAIARGGLTLSHAMAEGLELREVQSIRTELYDESCKRDTLSLFGECRFKDISRVIVVDDIADSGATFKFVMEYLQRSFPEIDFKSVALFYKPSSVYEPHFWINEAKNWIDFFWERDYKNED